MEIVPNGPSNPGFEPATFQSQVQRSTDWATGAPYLAPINFPLKQFQNAMILIEFGLIGNLYTEGIQLCCSFRRSMFRSYLIEWKCNIHIYTALLPISLSDNILSSLVLVHVGYIFCNWHSLNTNFYGITVYGMPGSFDSSHINAYVVGIRVLGSRSIVSSKGIGLHKLLPRCEFQPCTSSLPGKRFITKPRQLFF